MMIKVYPLALTAAALAAALASGCGDRGLRAAQTVRLQETRRLMGVPWIVTVHAADATVARAGIAAAFAEVQRLEGVLSDYDPDSELSRLSARAPMLEPVAVSADLWAVLARAVEIRDRTAGLFDPTVGPLTTLWRQARRSGRLPTAEKLARALAAVGRDAIVLVPEGRRVLLGRPDTRLDLGGIGMGYAADRALQAVGRHGIEAAMIDASGDIVVSGPPPGTAGWRIAVGGISGAGGEPGFVTLTHGAITTSGDAFQAVEIDGRRYSHIVDPRTGLGVHGPAAVSVLAPDATTADAVATAASVAGPEDGPTVIDRFPGSSGLFTWQEGGEVRRKGTPGWPGPR